MNKKQKPVSNNNENELVTKGYLRMELGAVKEELKHYVNDNNQLLRLDINEKMKESEERTLKSMKDMENRLMDVLVDFMGEKRKSEENRTIVSYQVSGANDRLDILEDRVAKLEKQQIKTS